MDAPELLTVALYTSAWIEMPISNTSGKEPLVALYTSAWIEIVIVSSLPIRE